MADDTKTAGAIKAGDGRYTFDLARLSAIDAGPGYSTAHGPVVEGERIQIGLMRMPRGTGGRPHSHPNEQWIYVLEGTLETEDGHLYCRIRKDGVRARFGRVSMQQIAPFVVEAGGRPALLLDGTAHPRCRRAERRAAADRSLTRVSSPARSRRSRNPAGRETSRTPRRHS